MNPKDPKEIESECGRKGERVQVPECPVPASGQEQEASEADVGTDPGIEGPRQKRQSSAECRDKQALPPKGTKDQVRVVGDNGFKEQHQSCPARGQSGVSTMHTHEPARVVKENAVHPKPRNDQRKHSNTQTVKHENTLTV